MAERVVSVRFQAKVEGFTAGMRKARASVDDLTKADVPKAAKAYSDLANKAALAGSAIAVGLGVAVKRFADFDQAMSAVRANSGATGQELDALRAAALQLGADSQFSAAEAAQGINELAKAGVESQAILGGGLKGALDLAAAGQIEVGQAAETAATAMVQFQLSGAETTHVADLLTNGANKAQGGVLDLGNALRQSGQVAAATGLSIEETTAGLTAFAAAGLVGSDAGTSFKTMLQRLSAPSGEAQEAMQELGISAYDSQGNFVGLAEVAGQLQESMQDLTPAQRNAALATIFGADAVRAANVLYAEGEQGIRQWTDAVNEQGAAARQAAELTDNLNGDVERLGGALDSVFISTGSGANSALRTLVQGLTGLVDQVGKIPGPVLLAGGALAGLALAVPKGITVWREYKASLDALGISLDKVSAKAPRTANALGKIGDVAKGIAVAAVAVGFLGDKMDGLRTQELQGEILGGADALDTLNESINELNAEGFGNGATNVRDFGDVLRYTFEPGFLDQAAHGIEGVLGVFGVEQTNDISVAADRLAEVDATLSGLVSSGNQAAAASLFRQLSAEAERQGVSIDALKAKLPQYTETLAGVANASRDTAGDTSALGTATGDLEQQAQDAEQALADLKAAISGLGSPVAEQRQANRDYQAAIDAVNASIKENGETLNANTEKGRANQSALDELARATKEKVAADFAATGSTEKATKAMQDGRQAFIDAATEAGMTETKAKALADQLGLIPDDVEILVSQSGAEAAGDAIDQAARDRTARIRVVEEWTASSDGSRSTRGGVTRAMGGAVFGPGSGTSDSIPAWLSNGEHVWTAAEVAKLGGQSAMYALRKAVQTGWRPGFANGGAVQQYAPRVQYLPAPSATITLPRGMGGSDFDYDRLAAAMSRVSLSVAGDGRGYQASAWAAGQRGQL